LGSLERGNSFGSCRSCLEAARKRYQQHLEGPEKEKGQKLEGKGPVILLMCRRPTLGELSEKNAVVQGFYFF
jgi:hypothetical protein